MENKKKYAVWLHPETKNEIEELFAKDNCHSQSEFVEKAIRYYIGYLKAEDAFEFLPITLSTAMIGVMSKFGDRIGSLLFKLSVEQNISNNLLAADMDLDEATYKRLRGNCVHQVKSSNGQITFQDAIRYQRKV